MTSDGFFLGVSPILCVQNRLSGPLPRFTPLESSNLDMQIPWPSSLRQLTLSSNGNVSGVLPSVAEGAELEVLQLDGTGVVGSIPQSWNNFEQLQQMSLHNTKLQCQLQAT